MFFVLAILLSVWKTACHVPAFFFFFSFCLSNEITCCGWPLELLWTLSRHVVADSCSLTAKLISLLCRKGATIHLTKCLTAWLRCAVLTVLIQWYGVHCNPIYRNYVPGKLTCGLLRCKTFNISTFLWCCFRQLYHFTLLTYICDTWHFL